MNYVVFLSVFLFSTFSFAQENVSYVDPNWRVGTVKEVTRVDSNVVWSEGVQLMATAAVGKCQLEIVGLQDSVYEVLFVKLGEPSEISMNTELEGLGQFQQKLIKLIRELEEELYGFEYSLKVDQYTGQAFEIVNENEYMSEVNKILEAVFNMIIKEAPDTVSDQEIAEIKATYTLMMQEKYQAIIQTTLNDFNYIFQAYSFPFIENEDFYFETELTNVDQINNPGGDQMTDVKTFAKRKGSLLELHYEYLYDREEMYEKIVVDEGLDEKVPLTDFDMEEEVFTNFNVYNSWILNCRSVVNVKMGSTVVHNATYITLK